MKESFIDCNLTPLGCQSVITYNAAVWVIFCVVEFWGKMAKPLQYLGIEVDDALEIPESIDI